MADGMKPCPFCGDVAEISCYHVAYMDKPTEVLWKVQCIDCGAKIGDMATEHKAKIAWNSRHRETISLFGEG